MTKFWAFKTGNFWLSNFYKAPLIYQNKTYATSEHLYQALKCNNEKDHEEVRLSDKPKQAKIIAKHLGGGKSLKEKINFMRLTIDLKFTQHTKLRELLLETEGLIIEDSPFDDLWGVGPDGDGINLMGILLMELREKYISEQSFEEAFS